MTCPWHGNQYDVTTGELITDRRACLDKFEVRVESGAVAIRLPTA